jgi:hypothetical protein
MDEGMVDSPVSERGNRVHWFAGRVHQVLDEVTAGGLPVATLTAAETAEALRELSAAAARIEALRVALLAHAEVVEVAAAEAATSTGAWLAHVTKAPRGEAYGLVRLARAFEDPDGTATTGFTATRDALAAGRVRADQARVIVEAVQALRTWVPAGLRRQGEEHLLAEAADFDAPTLRRLGKHLLEVLDPDAAEAELARQVAAEEKAAADRVALTMHDDGNGTCHGSFRISSLHGAMLRTAIDALASPKRPDAIPREVIDDSGAPAMRSTAAVHGLAFQELLERYPAGKLPKAGGGLATVVVTIDVRWLESQLGVATIDTGGRLTAGQLRRFACQVGIIPQVLGSRSEVLDQGRLSRLFTTAQHLALRTRDKTCTAQGCTIPAAWCHAHHRTPWAKGGRTDVSEGRLLCPRHHTMIHHSRYAHTDLPGGKVAIVRRRQ